MLYLDIGHYRIGVTYEESSLLTVSPRQGHTTQFSVGDATFQLPSVSGKAGCWSVIQADGIIAGFPHIDDHPAFPESDGTKRTTPGFAGTIHFRGVFRAPIAPSP